MTYQPSGALSYWDIRSGRSVRELQTLPDLMGMEISGNNRFAAAATAEELVVVDLLSGEIAARARASGLGRMVFSSEGNQITAVAADVQGGRTLRQWYFGGRALLELGRPVGFPASGFQPRSLIYTAAGLAVAQEDGTISLTAGTETSILARDLRLPIHDLAFSGSRLAIATDARILLFDSPLFSTVPAASLDSGAIPSSQRSFSNPIPGPVGVEFLDEGRLLVSSRGEGSGRLYLVDTFSGNASPIDVAFASALKQLTVDPEGVIAVESSGLCRILDPQSFQTLFQYNAPGMNKLVFAFSDVLLGGRTSLTSFAAPLLQINRRTGETVPIEDPSLFIYDLLYDEEGSAVYSLAVERHGNSLSTMLKTHTGYNFERARTLYEFRGEDLGASVVADPEGQVYTSLGFDTVRVWSGGRGLVFEASRGVPRRLHVHGPRLYSLNRDSSISVWDLQKRSWLMDITLLKDTSWVALTSDGGAVTSEGAQQYLSRGLP
jgi:WD40 repeat protein